MKTLIFEGAARKNGTTAEMLAYVKERLDGEVEVIRCYDQKVSPCLDCRFCLKHPTCAVKDGMIEIYEKIDSCDNILFAAPVYFHSVPGPMKIVIDRFQPYWASVVRKDRDKIRPKKGGIILAGGAPPFEKQFIPSVMMLQGVMHDLNASCEAVVTFPNTDRTALAEQSEVRAGLDALCAKLNQMES